MLAGAPVMETNGTKGHKGRRRVNLRQLEDTLV